LEEIRDLTSRRLSMIANQSKKTNEVMI